MSGNVAPRHAHKASKQGGGEWGDGREGRKEASGQLPSSNSFKFPLEEGRKEGRMKAGNERRRTEARREGRIRFAAEKIHIKGAMQSRERDSC